MWSCFTVVGLVALVLCVLPLVSFLAGKKIHRNVNTKIVQMLVFATIYLVLDVFPSLALYTDMQCRSTTTGGMGTSGICAFQRCAVHLLQVVYYLMATSLFELELKIYKVRNADKITKVAHAASFVVPLLCCICTAAIFPSVASQYPNNYYELWGWNFLKDPFRCTMQLETSALEWAFVHAHFVGLSLAVIGMCASVIKRALASAMKQPGGGSATDRTGSIRSVIKGTVLLKGVRDAMNKSKTGKLVALAVQVTVLVIVQLIIQIVLASVLGDFSVNLELWQSCAYTAALDPRGISICDAYKNASEPPPAAILLLYYLSGPLIAMVVGLTFGYDKKHVTVFKVLTGMSKVGVSGHSSVAPSTVG
jgi:hypothetical protein